MIEESKIDFLQEAIKDLSGRIAFLCASISNGATAYETILTARECETRASNGASDAGRSASRPNALSEPLRASKPPLPDPRLVRRIIWQRQQRARFFDSELMSDPVWDMLLDLTAATAEFRRVSVTSLCIASGVPPTTALRWIGVMAEHDLVSRVDDPLDRRRAYITLTNAGMLAVARYFDLLGATAKHIV